MTISHDEFDWDAWYRDTRVLSPEARGAWADCLYHQRLSPQTGSITLPLSSYASIFGTSPQTAKRILDEIGSLGVGDVTEDNGKVTAINRRMYRRFLELEGNKNRQAKWRENHKANGNNGNVTQMQKPPSYILEKETSKQESKKRSKRAIDSTRIPNPFPLTDEMRAWAEKNVPTLRDLDSAHFDFVEYWTNNTTAKAFKVDWRLTWQKGMKLALGWQKEKNADKGRPDPGKQAEPVANDLPACDECDSRGRIFPNNDWKQSYPCPKCNAEAKAA